MLLRICLIIAVVAGLGGVGLVHTQLKDKITGLNTTIEERTGERDRYQQESTKAKTAERTAKAERDEANKLLSTATNDLSATIIKANEQEKRANDLSSKFNAAMKERNEAQAQLASWEVIGLNPGQVKEVKEQLKNTITERDALIAQTEVMGRENRRLTNELNRYIGEKEDLPVPLPAGLKGKVIAVDPKWDFVVLDIGSTQGVLERGEMLVNRDGKLIAKVRIASVETNRCIANILSKWKQSGSEVMEGDQVFY
jgi:chromosome segregation ATPase